MLITVLVLLLSAQVQHSYCHRADASFPRIIPSRLQFFEYESVFINCEGFFNDLTEWRVMRKFNNIKTICNVKWEKTGPCNITATFTGDSGEYWCEAKEKKSSIVNIVVTAGSVILESPVLPVMEGDDVILHCRTKKTSSLKADFYKDGILKWRSSTGNMTIHRVSKSDEGHYKCNISGADESAESWLSVRGESVILESPPLPVMEGNNITLHCRSKKTFNLIADFYKDGRLIGSSSRRNMTIHHVSKSNEGFYKCNISEVGESEETWLTVREALSPDYLFTDVFTLVWIVIAVFLLAFLLLLVGLYHRCKAASTSLTYIPTSSPLQAVSAETGADNIIYSAVTILRKKNDTSVTELQQATNGDVTTQEPKNRRVSAETGPNYIIYSAVTIPGKKNDTSVAELQHETDVDVTTQEPKNRRDTSEAELQQATNVDVTTQEAKNRRDEDESVASCVYHTLSLVPSVSADPR